MASTVTLLFGLGLLGLTAARIMARLRVGSPTAFLVGAFVVAHAELLVVGKVIQRHEGPTIVAGDLNDVAWSHTSELFRRLSRLLDPRIGRGLLPTFHADHKLLRWPLDHVFHSSHFRLQRLERLTHIGSDHYPIYIRLSYEPSGWQEQEDQLEKADAEDHEEAEAKIEEGVTEAAQPTED